VTATAGERVLDWMLRRLRQAVELDHDLVIVHDSPALADVGPCIDVHGDTWRVAHVTGELTLRDALPEADRLIALVPTTFPPLPMDIEGRAYLGRILDVRADDVIAAVSGRFCEAVVDEGLARAVFDSLDTLRATAGRWSLGDLVTSREVRNVLVGAELGAARLDRERDWELLARFILHGAPTFRAPTLVRAALIEAQPRTGAWLGWALTEGSLEQLCTAGALMPEEEPAKRAPAIPGLSPEDATDRLLLGELVDAALREVSRTNPARASEMLLEAERTARTLDLSHEKTARTVGKTARSLRLLRVPLNQALVTAAHLCAEGTPPDDADIEGLRRNLHAVELGASIDMVGHLARLARFQAVERPGGALAKATATSDWFEHALRHVAWADLAFRRIRRLMEVVEVWLGDLARRTVDHWLATRDRLNAEFAEWLSAHWAGVARSTDLRRPLALHQLTRCVMRRLVDDGNRVLLLVLDGCDVASFFEIAESLPTDLRLGLVLPDVRDATLRDDLAAMGALGVAISPLPTVTSHARRALFAGEIPGNSALDDTESAAANATADKAAWKRNTALGDIPRRLFLKGDLDVDGTGERRGQPLIDALRAKELRVVAAVWNGVDDALSSKETTPLAAWSLGGLGARAAEVLTAAVDEGWVVLITADHGHTPFVAPERKLGPAALGQRYSAEASAGTVEFRDGPMPQRPLHLAARFGGWFGSQSRGFHGGAGLEEVAVPLAFLGRIRGEQEGRPRAPSWWWTTETVRHAQEVSRRISEAPPRALAQASAFAEATSAATGATPSLTTLPVLDPRLASLSDEEKRVLALLMRNQSARLSEVARLLGKPPMRVSGLMQQLVRKLFELGVPCVKVEVLPDNDRLYKNQPVDRDPR
jgi:hypothetical protein